jgi:hypothetical protein
MSRVKFEYPDVTDPWRLCVSGLYDEENEIEIALDEVISSWSHDIAVGEGDDHHLSDGEGTDTGWDSERVWAGHHLKMLKAFMRLVHGLQGDMTDALVTSGGISDPQARQLMS